VRQVPKKEKRKKKTSIITEGKTQNSAFSGEGDEKVFSVWQNASQPTDSIQGQESRI